ncbi:MAG: hypothetical protein M1813_004361 [Trichoglossum hirsutum]|nr:MAG: hypothetical protein M1813_004361 [Trichoglossum hirsutum]
MLKICSEHPEVQPSQQNSILSILQWVAEFSLELRYLTYLPAEICVKQEEKMVIWVGAPWEQKLLEEFIKPIGIDVESIYGGMATMLRQPPSQPVGQQAIGRCRRIGQTKTQRVWRLYLRESWDEWAEGNALVKLLPSLMAEMNDSVFFDDEPEQTINMDKFASIKRLILVDNELEFGDESVTNPLTPEEIAKELVKILNRQGSVRRKERSSIG